MEGRESGKGKGGNLVHRLNNVLKETLTHSGTYAQRDDKK